MNAFSYFLLLLLFAAIAISAFLGNVLIYGGGDGDREFGLSVALRGVGSVSYEYLRSEVFAAIPLFMLLGDFENKSGSARDLYNVINRNFRFIPGRLAVASVAGSACLGMIIPPTEAVGVGPVAAVLLGILKGMKLPERGKVVVESGKAAAPIFAPITLDFFDPIAFAVFGILAIEAGLLTPPFGLLGFTVKGTVEDKSVKLSDIFVGSVPYWILMLIGMMMIWAWPEIATWLPSKTI